jgi:hypothetical protein
MSVWGSHESIQRLTRRVNKRSAKGAYLFMLNQYLTSRDIAKELKNNVREECQLHR